jgi:GDP-mannose 6-dehydrogenase
MNVTVFGLGYVGCVSASCLAKAGHRVIGVDIVPEKVTMINSGTAPVIEPGLGELLAHLVANGRLSATTSAEEALRDSDLALICVGTPDEGRGHPNLDGLKRVVSDMGRCLSKRERGLTIVLRSTVLPGTTEQVLGKVLDAQIGQAVTRFPVAVNPEFMREGSSLQDFEHPPFVLVGCAEAHTADVLRSLYAGVDAPFVQTTVRTAEMVKYVCNAFHALKVCFSNEVGDLCDALGADAQEVMRIFRMDRKLNVSEAYFKPGFAFGGSCLPKDVRALTNAARIHDVRVPLLSSIMPANEHQVLRGVEAVLKAGRRRVGIVGLAFKSGTDDLRESPMVTLVERLIGKGCDVRIHDPSVSMARLIGANRRYIDTEIPHIASLLCDDVEELVAHADVLILSAADPQAARAVALARPEMAIVDLTRGAVPRLEARPAELAECLAE